MAFVESHLSDYYMVGFLTAFYHTGKSTGLDVSLIGNLTSDNIVDIIDRVDALYAQGSATAPINVVIAEALLVLVVDGVPRCW